MYKSLLMLFVFGLVIGFDFAAGNVAEFAFEHHFLELRQVVGEDNALQVVVFVLDYTGHISLEMLFAAFASLVSVFNVNFRLAGHVLVNVGQT